MKYLFLVLQGLFLPCFIQAQSIRGKVYELNEKQDTIPSIACVVYDAISKKAVTTSSNGLFEFSGIKSAQLIFNKIGFEKDTLLVDSSFKQPMIILLNNNNALQTVEIIAYEPSIKLSSKSITFVNEISKAELGKAACCNLGESFETNPSVDVAISDAITGSKQIQLLGLAGYQTLITKSNIPFIQGNAQAYGLQSIPGSWIDKIYVSKGVGPVVNGYKGIAGQINVELMDPKTMPRLYLNTYYGDMGRLEHNAIVRTVFNDKWQHGAFLHYANILRKADNNKDGFLDNAIGSNVAAEYFMNYNKPGKWEGKWEVGYSNNQSVGGELDGKQRKDNLVLVSAQNPLYKVKIGNSRFHVNSKTGFFFKNRIGASLGIQAQYSLQDLSLRSSLRSFTNTENSFYANAIYQDIVNNTNHTYRLGASFESNTNSASMSTPVLEIQPLLLPKEQITGLFGEWQENFTKNFNIIVGSRLDYHSLMGWLFAPRIHGRLALFNDRTIVRFSGGKAYRNPNVYSENIGLFMAHKQILPDTGVNLKSIFEDAWNVGGNLTQKFKLNYRDGYVTIDAYATQFVNQYVIDAEQSADVFLITAQKNTSAFASQIEFYYEILRKMNVRIAFKYYDTKAKYAGNTVQKPYQSKYRAFINFAYETKSKWAFNTTFQYYGEKRLATIDKMYGGPVGNYFSHPFVIANAQINKAFAFGLDAYVGVENMFNYRQYSPIIDGENPYSKRFDATVIYAPIYGRMFYVGVNYKLK
jgi:outer membrane receptor for ferrienterochelin and colicins